MTATMSPRDDSSGLLSPLAFAKGVKGSTDSEDPLTKATLWRDDNERDALTSPMETRHDSINVG